MSSIWPVVEHPTANYTLPQVITFDSHAPHHEDAWADGVFKPGNHGCDFQANMHDRWVAIAHKGAAVTVRRQWESLGACGVACELQWRQDENIYNLRYCHGHEHYFSRWPMGVGGTMDVGDHIGEVGMTGLTTGPHLHLAASVGAPWGGLLEQGTRVRVEELLAEIQASYEEDDMTEYEQAQLQAAWDSAGDMEASAGFHDQEAAKLRADAKAIKNAVRMAKGEAVEQ